ncbi:MAG: Putative Lipolytic enzyme, GDSL family [Nitrospira sp.]|nr:MAG: Putative Lipolytic enzyme, GDSL family [Nitrospira sp.]
MRRTIVSVPFLPTLLLSALQVFFAPTGASGEQIRAAMPAPQPEAWWMERHERAVARIRQGQVDLVFIGDSITQGWEEDGHPVWNVFYQHRHAANLGYNGDQTDNVLWRLQNGELEGITPKLAVVLIGTNNATRREDPPEETAAGIQAILTTLRTRLPDTKILLLALFPRGLSADDPLRQVNNAVNDRLQTFADQRQIFFLDLSRRFLGNQGRLPEEIMPDALHPSERGYRLWAEGMEDVVKRLMDE